MRIVNRVYFNNHNGSLKRVASPQQKTTRIKFKVVRRLETIIRNCAAYSIYSHALLTKNDQEYFSSRKTIQKTRPKTARHILSQTPYVRVSTPHRDNTSRHIHYHIQSKTNQHKKLSTKSHRDNKHFHTVFTRRRRFYMMHRFKVFFNLL